MNDLKLRDLKGELETLHSVLLTFWNDSSFRIHVINAINKRAAILQELSRGPRLPRTGVAAYSEAVDNPTSLTDRGTFGLGRF